MVDDGDDGDRGTAAGVPGAAARTRAAARRALPVLLALIATATVPTPRPSPRAQVPGFIAIAPPEGTRPVHLAPAQVVRIGRAEGWTVVDTTAYVQQRTPEAPEALARRVAAAGVRLVALTDLSGRPTWLAAERVVLVRDTGPRHAPGARAALVMDGLRNATDVAVRETVDEVVATLARAAASNARAAPP